MKLVEFLFPKNHDHPTPASVEKILSGSGVVKDLDSEAGRLTLETDGPIHEVEGKLKSVYDNIKLVGISSTAAIKGAAVAIIGGIGTRGVIRLVQDEASVCVDGTVSGLEPGRYQVSVNEFGDISNACLSTGPILSSADKKDQGILGLIEADGSADETRFFSESQKLDISDCIGRSLVLQSADGSKKVACGIIGRSPGVAQNSKRICACDGTVLWEEQVFGPYAVAPPTE